MHCYYFAVTHSICILFIIFFSNTSGNEYEEKVRIEYNLL